MYDIFLTAPVCVIALFVRFFIAIRMVPLMAAKSLPLNVAGGVAVALALFLMPSVDLVPVTDLSISALIVIMLNEAFAGLLFGGAVRFCWMVMAISGGITSKYALSVTPETHTAFWGKLYFCLGTAVFFLLNGHHSLFLAAARALEAMPPLGRDVFLFGDIYLWHWLLNTFAAAFQFGVLVAAPIWVAALIVELLMAYGARLFCVQRSPMFLSVRTCIIQIVAIGFLWKTITILVQFPFERIESAWGWM